MFEEEWMNGILAANVAHPPWTPGHCFCVGWGIFSLCVGWEILSHQGRDFSETHFSETHPPKARPILNWLVQPPAGAS